MNLDILFNSMPILETERLTLRDIKESDIDSLFKIYSDSKVAEFDDFQPIQNKEQAISCCNYYKNQFHKKEEARWGIVCKKDNMLIGTYGISHFDQEVRMCEIGYDMMRNQWNKGYMTEAIGKIVEFVFETLGANRIQADIDPRNPASSRVLEKNNFIREGFLRQNVFFKDQLWDSVIWAILKSDYDKK